MSSLVHSHEFSKATALSCPPSAGRTLSLNVVNKCGSRGLNFRFIVLVTVAKYFFSAVEREGGTYSTFWVPPALVLPQKKYLATLQSECGDRPRSTAKILGCSTRNRKFKRLEPHLQPSATRSAPKEDTKSAGTLTHGSAPRNSYPICQILAR